MSSDQSLLNLFESYSNEFYSQFRRINSFTNNHPTAIGTSHEGILRRFLQRYIPKRMAVSEGFISGGQNIVSKQCDIIIWSHLDYAPIYQEGDFVIVPERAVRAVIEVKTTLHESSLHEAFKNLQTVRNISDEIYTAIFAFESINAKPVFKHIIEIDRGLSNAVHSIHGMSGWYLQRTKDIDLGKRLGTLMETRPTQLKEFTELLPFTVFLMPLDKTIARVLTHFLAFLFTALGLNSPTDSLAGSKLNGFIFPGYGVKVFSDCFSCEGECEDFLSDTDLQKYLNDIQAHMKELSNQ